MKSFKFLKFLAPILLINHCASSAKAQHQPGTVKEKYHIKIVLEENGNKRVIDTTFNSLDDLRGFKDQMTPKTRVEHHPQRQWHHKIITEDIFIDVESGDTAINKKIYTKKLTANDFKHIHEMLHSEAFEKADIVTILGVDSLKDNHQLRVEAFLTFIDIETPTPDELKNNHNPEIQKATKEKGLEVTDLSVFPNPTNGELNVNFETAAGDVKILLTDLQGKEIYTENFYSPAAQTVQRSISINGQKNGVYLLKITQGEKSAVRKIILGETGR